MMDYEPLDLSAARNAGPEVCAGDRPPAIGAQVFHGLPFQIGSTDGSPCFVAFGDDAPLRKESVAIPVGKTARWVLFAHAQLTTGLHDGDPPGRVVARYTIIFQDGERIELPIRERFEISVVPVSWGE